MAEKVRYNKIIDLLEHGKPVFSTSTVPNGSLDDLSAVSSRVPTVPTPPNKLVQGVASVSPQQRAGLDREVSVGVRHGCPRHSDAWAINVWSLYVHKQ